MSGEGRPISGLDRRYEDHLVEVNLDVRMGERLKMPTDGMPAIEHCNCYPCVPAIIKTVWIGADKDRRVMTCVAKQDKRCNFNIWLDGPFNKRASAVIDYMYNLIEKLEFENSVVSGLQNIQWLEYEEETSTKDEQEASTSSGPSSRTP